MAMLVVVDGPSGAGKSTLSKMLAQAMRYQFLDTGKYYRALASVHRVRGGDPLPLAYHLSQADLERPDLRSPEITRRVALYSERQALRLAINKHLREEMGDGNWVMDGRAGGYEFSEAQVKLFLTAELGVRATRRWNQDSNEGVTFEEVYNDLDRRDWQDTHRPVSPLLYNPTLYHAKVDSTYHASLDQTLVVMRGHVQDILRSLN